MDFNRKLVINYQGIYGTDKQIDESSLSVLDKVMWAKVLARLNHLARNNKNDGIIDVLKNWFSEANKEHANLLLNRIINAYKDSKVHPTQLLTINLWSNLYILDEILKTQIDPENRLNDKD